MNIVAPPLFLRRASNALSSTPKTMNHADVVVVSLFIQESLSLSLISLFIQESLSLSLNDEDNLDIFFSSRRDSGE